MRRIFIVVLMLVANFVVAGEPATWQITQLTTSSLNEVCPQIEDNETSVSWWCQNPTSLWHDSTELGIKYGFVIQDGIAPSFEGNGGVWEMGWQVHNGIVWHLMRHGSYIPMSWHQENFKMIGPFDVIGQLKFEGDKFVFGVYDIETEERTIYALGQVYTIPPAYLKQSYFWDIAGLRSGVTYWYAGNKIWTDAGDEVTSLSNRLVTVDQAVLKGDWLGIVGQAVGRTAGEIHLYNLADDSFVTVPNTAGTNYEIDVSQEGNIVWLDGVTGSYQIRAYVGGREVKSIPVVKHYGLPKIYGNTVVYDTKVDPGPTGNFDIFRAIWLEETPVTLSAFTAD